MDLKSEASGTFRNFNIYPKLVVSFLLAIIPILTISYLSITSGESKTSKEISASLSSRVHFYLNSFELEMSRVMKLNQQYIFDDEIQSLSAFSSIMTNDEKRIAVLNIQKKLLLFRNSSLYVDDVKLYLRDVGRIIQSTTIQYGFSNQEVERLSQALKGNSRIVSLQNQLVIGEEYPLKLMDDADPSLSIEVIISKAQIVSTLQQLTKYTNAKAMMMDNNGNWSISSGNIDPAESLEIKNLLIRENFVQPGQKHVKMGGKSFFVAYEHSKPLNLTFLIYVPDKQIFGPVFFYKVLFWVLLCSSIVIVLLFSYWIYQLIHKPINRLVRAFRKLEQGEFHTSLSHTNRDEFQYLYHQFNGMVQRLQKLIQDVYVQEIRSQRAELKQLQSQINPHFLYNSFFLLNRMAHLQDNENISRFTRHLGSYFQYITRNSADEVDLEKEINHAKAYMEIQSLRFIEKIEVRMDEIPPGYTHLKVPRLIIQPILENAFEHGLEEKEEGGWLEFGIKAEEQFLVIIIEDNGDRLTDEKLSQLQISLLAPNEATETTGIVNVHRRLQLKFGENCGLKLSRGLQGVGLRVEIRMPKQTEDGGSYV